jgi:hypothetical protein
MVNGHLSMINNRLLSIMLNRLAVISVCQKADKPAGERRNVADKIVSRSLPSFGQEPMNRKWRN